VGCYHGRFPQEKNVSFKFEANSKGKNINRFKNIKYYKFDSFGHVRAQSKKTLKYEHCKKDSHEEKYCSAKNNKACSICRKFNHAVPDCFYRSKQNDKKNDKDKGIDSKDKSSLSATCMPSEMLKNFEFVTDSGSTCHIVNTRTTMLNTKSLKENIEIATKGQKMHTECVGSLMYDECNLNKVYYVPDLKRNSLSVHEITKNDCILLFNNKWCKSVER
jgi:hypothetical protein